VTEKSALPCSLHAYNILSTYSPIHPLYYFSFSFFFGGTQGFVLAKQALYHSSHVFSPFFSGYFGDGLSRTICLDWHGALTLPISAFQVARLTCVSHQCSAFLFLKLILKRICIKSFSQNQTHSHKCFCY
jgi:hypothetical protein